MCLCKRIPTCIFSRLSPPALAQEELSGGAAGELCTLHYCALGPPWEALCLMLLSPWGTLSTSLQESFPLMTQLEAFSSPVLLAGGALDL